MTRSVQLWRAWFDAVGAREVTLLLFVGWDPIGLNDDIVVWREYEPYAWLVVDSVSNGADDRAITDLLGRIADQEIKMGGPPSMEFAGVIRRWIQASAAVWDGKQTVTMTRPAL